MHAGLKWAQVWFLPFSMQLLLYLDIDGAVAKTRAAIAELMEESAHLNDMVGEAAVGACLLELRFASGALVSLLATPVACREVC
jgi:hypothetical protein